MGTDMIDDMGGSDYHEDIEVGTSEPMPHDHDDYRISVVPWLDPDTMGLVQAITATVAHRHPQLRAVILFGSIARHEERPLNDPVPSDVDLLLLFDLPPNQPVLSRESRLAIFDSIGLALDQFPQTPREVQVRIATGELSDWDPAFVANVTRDGLLLWARSPLRGPLANLSAWNGSLH